MKVRNQQNKISVVTHVGYKIIKKGKEIIYIKFKIVMTSGQGESRNWGRDTWGFRGSGQLHSNKLSSSLLFFKSYNYTMCVYMYLVRK